jgi:MFS family permease
VESETEQPADAVPAEAHAGLIRPELVLALPVFATRMVYLGTITLLPLLLLERGVPVEYVGFLVGMYGYAAVGMGLLAGVLADRFSPARLAAGGSALVSVAIGLLLASGQPLIMGAARLLHGVAMGLFRPAAAALVLQRVPAERRASAIAINNVAYVCGAAAGPLTAGLLADRFGLAAGLLAGIAVALLAAAYLLLLGGRRTGVAGPRPSILQSLRDLPSLVRRRQLGTSLTYVLADMTILHLWLVYLPLYLVQQWEYTLVAVGSLISIEALAYAFSQPIWGRILDRGRPQLSIVLSLAAHGLLISLVPLAGGSWPALVVVLVACGALNAATYPGCVALTAARVRDTERGRAMGLLSSTSDVGQIVGPLVGSLVVLLSGRAEVALVSAVGLATAGVTGGILLDRRGSASRPS